MRKVIGIIAGLAATGVIGLAAPAAASPNEVSEETGDYLFKRGLELQGLLFNFPLEKRQALRYCDTVARGGDHIEAIYSLMDHGGYAFDIASGIASAAASSYCLEAVSAAMRRAR